MSYPPSSPSPNPWQSGAAGGGQQPQGQPGNYPGGEALPGGTYPGGYPVGGPLPPGGAYPSGPVPGTPYPGGQYPVAGVPQGGYGAPGGYGSPPYGMPPQRKSGATVAILIALVAVLAVGGGVAAFFLLGKDDGKATVATPTAQPDAGREVSETEAPFGTDESFDEVDEPGPGIETIFTFNPQPGECLNWPRFYGGAVGQPDTVDCSETHDGEVMEVAPLPSAEYPGEDNLLGILEPLCVKAFRDYVGIDYGQSQYEVYMTGPSQVEYELGARNYACYAIGRQAGQMQGSVKGAKK